jgi:hypothetical protein
MRDRSHLVLLALVAAGGTFWSRWLDQVAPSALACQPQLTDDGQQTGPIGRDGKTRLNLPAHVGVRWTRDCQRIAFLHADYQWIDGRLLSANELRLNRDPRRGPTVRLYASHLDEEPSERRPDRSKPWQLEAIPHRKYPLVYYPKGNWRSEDTPGPHAHMDPAWGVSGTLNADTGRPYRALCDMNPVVNPTGTAVDGDFPSRYPGAKCRTRLVAVGANYRIGALVDVWAEGVPEIDKILRALESELRSFVAAN